MYKRNEAKFNKLYKITVSSMTVIALLVIWHPWIPRKTEDEIGWWIIPLALGTFVGCILFTNSTIGLSSYFSAKYFLDKEQILDSSLQTIGDHAEEYSCLTLLSLTSIYFFSYCFGFYMV
jgi:hypothetical protein